MMLKKIIVFIFCILSQKNAQRIISSTNIKQNLRGASNPLSSNNDRLINAQRKIEIMKKEISMKMIQLENEMKNAKKEMEEKFRKIKS